MGPLFFAICIINLTLFCKSKRQGTKALHKLVLQSALPGLAVALLSVAASGQESSSPPVVPARPEIQGTVLTPNFRVAAYDWKTLHEDNGTPDSAPETSVVASPQQGIVKRSVIRIGKDQKHLYLAPFERHNLKWDALVLVGTGAFLAADRRIENNLPSGHFTLYQATSDISIAGLSGSLAGIWIYGIKTENEHAKEMGEIELETLVNTFLIYTPMQFIAGRQRPGEGNGHGDFLKHHSINTSFPGGHAMFTWAMASVLADEYPKPWARTLSYGAAFAVTFTRFLARDHWASDMFLGSALGLAIAENTFHARCDPQYESQCRHHQWRWKPMKVPAQ